MRRTGILIAAIAVVLWLIDRTTGALSTWLGRLACGERYLQPVNGVVGDVSCGFNADLYLAAALLVFMLAGMALFLFARRRS